MNKKELEALARKAVKNDLPTKKGTNLAEGFLYNLTIGGLKIKGKRFIEEKIIGF